MTSRNLKVKVATRIYLKASRLDIDNSRHTVQTAAMRQIGLLRSTERILVM